MAERRRYTRKTKATAITTAVASSVLAASQELGIPESTLRLWWHHPDYAELREKTRAEIEEPSKVLAYMALQAIIQRLDEFKPADLVVLFGVMVDKAQLLSGSATSRTEHRELLADFDDHEREAMSEWLLEQARERLNAG